LARETSYLSLLSKSSACSSLQLLLLKSQHFFCPCVRIIIMEDSGESDTSTSRDINVKQKKTPQITRYEKNLLMDIINRKEIKEVIENKETNAVWTAQKNSLG